MEATFDCAVCGRVAGTIRLHVGEGAAEIRRESWPGAVIYPLPEGAPIGSLRAALASRDAPTLLRLYHDLTPFYCPDCDASYCSDHWHWWDVWDDEIPHWHDSVRGRCPGGHERMLED